MKKILLSALLMVFALTAPLYAAEQLGSRPGSFSVTPFLGGYTFDGEQHLETGPLFGIRGGYNFTRFFDLEALFSYVPTDLTKGGGDADAFNYRAEGIFNILPRDRWEPFLALGIGGTSVSYSSASGVSDRTNAVFALGGGVKYFLNDRMGLRGDIRHLMVTDGARHNWEYTLGMTFLFGGEKAAVAAIAPPPPPPAEKMVKYCMPLYMEFDIDKAVVRPEYHEDIGKVADFLKKFPTTTAVIEGHTDNVGTAAHNVDLSRRRAESVVNYLVEKYGIERSRLSAKGYGFSRPVADNSTEEGRQLNRRIEALIDCTLIELESYRKLPDYLCMSLNIQFDTDKAAIPAEYASDIARVAAFMKKHPTTTALIEGHTDNVGDPAYNLKLSQRRAESVVKMLVDDYGVEPARLSAKGYGDTRPVGYNDTADGRAKNRRIEAVIDCAIVKKK